VPLQGLPLRLLSALLPPVSPALLAQLLPLLPHRLVVPLRPPLSHTWEPLLVVSSPLLVFCKCLKGIDKDSTIDLKVYLNGFLIGSHLVSL
jgi:hypothetical protein